MNFIDAHLHLQDPRLANDSSAVIQRAVDAGVAQLFCNATSEADWAEVCDLANKYKLITPFLGVHPWSVDTIKPGWQERLGSLLVQTGAGVGEAGLDKFCDTDIQLQEEVFIEQLLLSRKLERPISIHCVGRWGRLIDLLMKYQPTTPLIHSFNGSLEVMHRLVDMGASLSFSTMMAHPEREKNREIFKQTPLNHILLETDGPDQFCPYLSGLTKLPSDTYNEPGFVAELYSFAAGLKKMDLKTFSNALNKNGQIFTN